MKGATMRMLMKVRIPTQAGNKGIKDGTLPDVIRKSLEALHPEAAYFTTMDGQRTMIAVFDMKASADMPRIAEPLFMGLDATIEFMPCMNADDLKTGLSALS
jgi:hypothetical protein